MEEDKPVLKEIETFASIASRPPSPKATHYTATEAAIAAATDKLAAAISKHQEVRCELTYSRRIF
jgi:hypothetical protein